MIYFEYLAPDFDEHVVLAADARVLPAFRVQDVDLRGWQDDVQVLAVVLGILQSLGVAVHV